MPPFPAISSTVSRVASTFPFVLAFPAQPSHNVLAAQPTSQAAFFSPCLSIKVELSQRLKAAAKDGKMEGGRGQKGDVEVEN